MNRYYHLDMLEGNRYLVRVTEAVETDAGVRNGREIRRFEVERYNRETMANFRRRVAEMTGE